jgi:glycopeptide antibiotics resistance protein
MTRRLRIFFSCALAVYTAFVLAVTLWPQRIDKPIDHQLRNAINSAHDAGAPRHLGYSLIQNVSNAGLFVPLGFLIAVVVVRRLWWLSPAICAVLSSGIELIQHFFIPNRVGSVADVVSNSVGSLIGAAFAVLLVMLVTKNSSKTVRRVPESKEFAE